MVMELIEQFPEVCDRLRRERSLLTEMDRYARELKNRHDAWTALIATANPGSSEGQVASAALELALKELADHLASASPPAEDPLLLTDKAMEAYGRHSPHG